MKEPTNINKTMAAVLAMAIAIGVAPLLLADNAPATSPSPTPGNSPALGASSPSPTVATTPSTGGGAGGR